MKAVSMCLEAALLISLLLITTDSFARYHPAELRIQNNSERQLTLKVMTGEGKKHATTHVGSNSVKTIDIYRSGSYYLKIKATYPKRKPVFKKGIPFRVRVGKDGYSVLTISYSIKESALPNPMSGEQISESEFEKDSD